MHSFTKRKDSVIMHIKTISKTGRKEMLGPCPKTIKMQIAKAANGSKGIALQLFKGFENARRIGNISKAVTDISLIKKSDI